MIEKISAPVKSYCALFMCACLALSGCATTYTQIDTVNDVDLNRFAGDWFVIASIPTILETNAYNAVETYAPPVEDRIETQFRFNSGSLDGPLRTYTPTAFVSDDSPGIWGMQFVWPFKAEYRIVHLDDAYQYTIVGRTKRDYVWIMSRQADISEAKYQQLVQRVAELGYDTAKLRRVPHGVTTAESISAASR